MRHRLLLTAMLLTVVMVGATSLPQPFDGDQSLFAMGAERWLAGDVYFEDFWDLKPPGIYAFYLVGGALFGFDEVGIHLFELLWSLVLAVVLTLTVGHLYQSRTARAVVPLITVGFYYSIADTWHLTQIEWLVALPLFVSLWVMCRPSASGIPSWTAFVVAGFCGGLVGLCKPMYGLIPAAFWWCSILLHSEPNVRSRWLTVASRALAFTAGVMLPLGTAAIYFYSHGVLDVALKTMFEYPPKVLAQKTDGYGMLLQGLRWFALMVGPMLALTLPQSVALMRTRRDPFSVGLVVWLVLGLGLVLVQRMWWEYHYLLILIPLTLLALRTLDSLAGFWQEQLHRHPEFNTAGHRLTVICSVCLLFCACPATLLYRTALLSTFGFAVNPEQRLQYQCLQHLEYQKATDETQFLHRPSARAGDIYVFGNPITYRFADRHQAIPEQGWSIKVYLPSQWTAIEDGIRRAEPAYVYVATNKGQQLQQRSHGVLKLLDEKYQIAQQSPHGTWYELSGQVPASPAADIITTVGADHVQAVIDDTDAGHHSDRGRVAMPGSRHHQQ